MSTPVAPGGSPRPLSPLQRRIEWGDSALTAPTTPQHRLAAVDKTKVDPQILKAAEGMEAMFLDYMMKVMRDTVPKSDMDLESPATKIYQNMLDSESAQRAAHAGGVGLADQIVAYLTAQQYNSGRPMVGPNGTGGTHEGQPPSGREPRVERRDLEQENRSVGQGSGP